MANNRTSRTVAAKAVATPSVPLDETMNQNGAQTGIDAILEESGDVDDVMAKEIKEATIISLRYNKDLNKFIIAITGDEPISFTNRNTLINALADNKFGRYAIQFDMLLAKVMKKDAIDVDAINRCCMIFAGLPVTYCVTKVAPNEQYAEQATFNNLVKIHLDNAADRECIIDTLGYLMEVYMK